MDESTRSTIGRLLKGALEGTDDPRARHDIREVMQLLDADAIESGTAIASEHEEE